jgi:hypothetical protein
MQLSFSRETLSKQLRVLVILSFLFCFGTVYAFAFEGEVAKRAIASVIMPLCALLTIWGAVKTLWLIRSGLPAARITNDGIKVHTFAGQKIIPWDGLEKVDYSEISAGKVSLRAIEIRPKLGLPVRLAINGLSQDPAEIDQWIGMARSRLAEVAIS